MKSASSSSAVQSGKWPVTTRISSRRSRQRRTGCSGRLRHHRHRISIGGRGVDGFGAELSLQAHVKRHTAGLLHVDEEEPARLV
jgi:hypothetical protein